jgi:cobalt-zinc-cadmium efflux system membrane fusion protein
VARQDLEATHARAQAAQAQAAAAQAQAVANGSPDQQGRLRITSPVDGVVGSVQVTPGAVVAAGSPVADIADPSRNELVFTAPPAVAAKVAPGMALEVSGPTGSFGARVIGSAADVRQPGGAAIIRATAVVVVDTTPGTLDVPSDAVQNVDGSTAVFVAIDGGFRAQPVLTGRRAGDRIEVLSGLQGNERVAGANAFLLKAELAKGDAEHGH